MELNEIPPKDGVTRAYCEICSGPLDLIGAALGALEQLDAEHLFECLHPAAQGRLLDAENLRRAREAFHIGGGHGGLEMADFNRHGQMQQSVRAPTWLVSDGERRSFCRRAARRQEQGSSRRRQRRLVHALFPRLMAKMQNL